MAEKGPVADVPSARIIKNRAPSRLKVARSRTRMVGLWTVPVMR
jgi:hypothetical protein